MTMATESEIFEEAARVLMKKGHCKGTLMDDEGRVCAAGALMTAAAQLGVGYDVPINAQRIAGEKLLGRPSESIVAMDFMPDWNDAPERTAEDVILLFKTLAHETREAS